MRFKLTPEYLASGKWTDKDYRCTTTLEFTAKGSFKFSGNCGSADGDWFEVSGSYRINGNKIIYKVTECRAGEDARLKIGDSSEATLSDRDSFQYRWYLNFENSGLGKIFNLNSLIKEGGAVSIKGIDAVSTGVKSGTVITSFAPTTSAKEIVLDICSDSLHASAKFFEKGTALTIYARTKNMDKAGKWNNYWYYVEFNDLSCEDGACNKGWVFGEFVKIK